MLGTRSPGLGRLAERSSKHREEDIPFLWRSENVDETKALLKDVEAACMALPGAGEVDDWPKRNIDVQIESDGLTKPLPKSNFDQFIKYVGMQSVPTDIAVHRG